MKNLYAHHHGNPFSDFTGFHSPVNYTPHDVPYLTFPGVVILARPVADIKSLAGFLSGFDPMLDFPAYLGDPVHLEDGAQLCKVAGQVCYMSFGSKRSTNSQAKKYFDNLKSSGHGSVFEHANYSLLLYGISRSLSHELVRHRSGFAYSMLSQRYVSGKTLRFVERPEYQANEILHRQFIERIDRAAQEYKDLTDQLLEMQKDGAELLSAESKTDLRKKVQQTARSVLPNETETVMVVTGNVRAWRHMIEQRASEHAEIEIRELALKIFLCLQKCEPLLFDDYHVEQLSDGTSVVKTTYGKV